MVVALRKKAVCRDEPPSVETVASYRPRRPESTVLHRVVREHLATFLADAARQGGAVPEMVERELRDFLSCGSLARGFARVRCTGCGTERLVAFSCKGRGFCPSCMGRRMTALSAHLVDDVIPRVPVRQWVLSLPVPLRYVLASDHDLCLAVLAVFFRALAADLRRRAGLVGIDDGRSGAVTVIQRFGGALNLNPHFHLTALDGVFEKTSSGDLAFHEAPMPSQKDITVLCSAVRYRTLALLRKRGLLGREADAGSDPFADHEPLLASIAAASPVLLFVIFGLVRLRPWIRPLGLFYAGAAIVNMFYYFMQTFLGPHPPPNVAYYLAFNLPWLFAPMALAARLPWARLEPRADSPGNP